MQEVKTRQMRLPGLQEQASLSKDQRIKLIDALVTFFLETMRGEEETEDEDFEIEG